MRHSNNKNKSILLAPIRVNQRAALLPPILSYPHPRPSRVMGASLEAATRKRLVVGCRIVIEVVVVIDCALILERGSVHVERHRVCVHPRVRALQAKRDTT